jgi:hypothetical protein
MSNIKFLAIVLLILATIGGIVGLKDGCKAKQRLKDVKENIAIEQTPIIKYLDPDSEEHARQFVELGDLHVAEAVHAKEIAELRHKLGIKAKQIEGFQSTVLQLQGQINTPLQPVVIHDTVTGQDRTVRTFEYSDQWIQFSGIVDTSDIHINYLGTIPLNISTYWRRKHKFLGIKFGRKVHFVDATSANPNIDITGLKSFKIE